MVGGIQALAALVHDSREYRRHKRVDLRFKVQLVRLSDSNQADYSRLRDDLGYTENISDGGLGLRWLGMDDSASGLHEGDQVFAEIHVPRADRCIRCLGRIAWIHEDRGHHFRAGMAFLGVNLDDLAEVQATLGAPAPVAA
jgi:hypothetical protein